MSRLMSALGIAADIPMQGPYGPFPLTAEHLQDGSDSMI